MLEVVVGNRLRDISRVVVSKIDVSDSLISENFVVVPDRFSLIAEKMIFEELGITSTFNIQVVGISKLARILLDEKNVSLEVLTQDECKLILLKILKNCELKSFKEKSLMLAEEFLKIISQLKSNNITSAEFYEAVKNNNNQKLNDIAKVFALYEDTLRGKYDQNDLLSKLAEKIEGKLKSNYFFVEFDNFTEQGRIILEKLILNAERVVVGALLPDKQKNTYIYDNDILSKINKVCRDNKIEYSKIFVKNDTTSEQEHILKNVYGFRPQKINNENVYLFNLSTPEEEIRRIAKIISLEIYSAGKRFLDFNIMMPKMEHLSILEKVFAEYKIPFFVDAGVLADSTKTVDFIFSILDFLKEESSLKFLDLLKNFYSRIEFEKYSEVENYLNKEGVFKLEEFCKQAQFGEDIIIFCGKLLTIKEYFKEVSDCEGYINLTRKILQIFEVEDRTYQLIHLFVEKNELKLEKIYQQIYKRIVYGLDVLEKYADIPLQFDEFMEILKNILNSKEIYSVPTALDCVFVGEVTKSYFEERKVLFVCQASQGALPVVLADSSVLSDKDIEGLSCVDISPTVRLINKRNKFKLIQSLTLAKEKIILSYSSSALGDKEEPSSLFGEMQKIFSKKGEEIKINESIFDVSAKKKISAANSFLSIQNDLDFANSVINLINKNVLSVGDLKKITNKRTLNIFEKDFNKILKDASDDSLVSNLLADYYSPENREKINNPKELYFKNGRISATQIEQFYQCPFRHFFIYGLRLMENEVCEFDGRDIGNYFHNIAEEFIKTGKVQGGFDYEFELDKLVDSVYKDERLARLRKCPTNKHIVAKLKNEAKMFIKQIELEQKWSDFKIYVTEKPFKYKLRDSQINLTGRIDRVDVCGEDVRVIDYKSGDISQSLSGVYYGIELQLFIYLLAMKRELSLRPVAGLYFPVGSDFVDNKSLKKLVLSGFIITESSVLKKLDKRLGPHFLKSDIVSVSLSIKSQDDNLIIDNSRRKNIFSEKGFSSVLNYTEALIHKALEDMSTGKIIAKPLKGKGFLPCFNCPYFPICSFLGEDDSPREQIGRVEEKDFIKIIEEDGI